MNMAPRKRKARRADQPAERTVQVPTNSTTIEVGMEWLRRQPLWIVLAVASGACAAINGVFAKL